MKNYDKPLVVNPVIATVFAEELAIHREEFNDIWGYSSIVAGTLTRLEKMLEGHGVPAHIVKPMIAEASEGIANITMKACDAKEGDHLIDLLPTRITNAGDRLHLVRRVMALSITIFADAHPERLAQEIENTDDPEITRRAVANALQHNDNL